MHYCFDGFPRLFCNDQPEDDDSDDDADDVLLRMAQLERQRYRTLHDGKFCRVCVGVVENGGGTYELFVVHNKSRAQCAAETYIQTNSYLSDGSYDDGRAAIYRG